jgi:hypothetical protein
MKEVLSEEEEMFLRSDPKDIDEYELKVIAESISVRCFHSDWTSETTLFQHRDTTEEGIRLEESG